MKENYGANDWKDGVNKKNPDSAKRKRMEKEKFEYEVLEPRQLLASISPDGQWIAAPLSVLQGRSGERLIELQNHGLFDLQEQAMFSSLSSAPLEFTPQYDLNAVTISIPRPDSTYARFKVVESPIMEAGLAAEFPDIKTYRGWGIDDPSATVRFDVTVHGFRAQVLSSEGNYYIDPYFKGQTEFYSSYYKQDVIRDPERYKFSCGCGGCGCQACGGPELTALVSESQEDELLDGRNFGTQLRTFRLANAATGEYTQFWGGTVAQGQAAIVTAVNRVTGVYERDLAIRFVLVANNSSLVYTNPNTDPYTNNNGSTMLNQNQTTVDSVIGNANYDIGHVFSTGGGGVASLGVVGVTGQKARGVTGLPQPTGDPFYIDYVAHEMGHQFNANHTFNGTGCGGGRVASSAYEPGSGSTIMAYAGICGTDDLQSFSDAMFHAKSIQDIRAFITSGAAASTGTNTATGNAVPTVTTSTGFVIPANTPFELTAIGSDVNTSQVLTYSWEQFNLGTAVSLTATDNGNSPIFRTWNPTTNPTRVFPRLSNLVANTLPKGEKLPTVNWNSMNFRVVVRDNASGGGGVNWANMSMQVVNTGAGFAVTSQNSATSWTGNSTQTLTWNVAGTTGSGINASTVDIWLSTDGGFTYPTLLAGGVANNGSRAITVPNISTSTARFKIKASNKVFFDINNANITITPSNVIANLSGPSVIPEGDVGTSIANFSITLSAASASTVSVNYATSSAGFANPATPGSDYIAVSGTATFSPGQTVFNIPVTIIGDRFTEGIEQFQMTLSNPSGLQLGTSTFVASISDDDAFELERIIDLGTPTSAVLAGASGFTNSPYSTFTGIGWTAQDQLNTFDLPLANAVTTDGVYGNSGNFRIDVPNGNYNVELVFGQVGIPRVRTQVIMTYAQFTVSVQGTDHALNLENGAYVTRTYSATVTNGQLNIGLQSGVKPARLSGIVVTAAAGRPGTGGNEDSKLAWFATLLTTNSESRVISAVVSDGQIEKSIPKRLDQPELKVDLRTATLDVDQREVDQFMGTVSTQSIHSESFLLPTTNKRIQCLDRWFESAGVVDGSLI